MRFLLVAAAVLLLAVPVASAVNKPRVWMTAQKPLVVRGAGFAKNDRVALTVRKGKLVLRKNVAAGSRGRFIAKFARNLPGTCITTTIHAQAKSGRKALYFGAAPLGCKHKPAKS
jgi:hypothetical protein